MGIVCGHAGPSCPLSTGACLKPSSQDVLGVPQGAGVEWKDPLCALSLHFYIRFRFDSMG